MKERPIVFSGEMIRSILDGRKSMTRRVVKPQPTSSERGGGLLSFQTTKYSWQHTTPDLLSAGVASYCPYGAVGDRLFVREAFGFARGFDSYSPSKVPNNATVYYAADEKPHPEMIRWRPSIHMPRWASRITLEITGVRVERLQDITEEDAKTEGLRCGMADPNGATYDWKAHFASLWDEINGKSHPWESNPWVWVVEFEELKGRGT